MITVSAPSWFSPSREPYAPSRQLRLLTWSIESMCNDQGRPYDHAAFPHLGAPGGPMDAFDDPVVRTISLQFATRLGKTFFAQCALLKTAVSDPCPMMVASSVEKLCKEVIKRLYKTAEKRPEIERRLLKPERLRRGDNVEFIDCEIFGAWSRSVSTLADKNIKVGHAGEYDKWEYESTSEEAHPHKLFDDRFKDYQSTRKVIYEGTPTISGHSPIESRRRNGWNCYFHVPCPECKRYQYLVLGGKDTDYGLKYDQPEGNQVDGSMAYRTARYMCRHCQHEIEDFHRSWMMRRGVWCPKGMEVDHKRALQTAEATIQDPGLHEWVSWKRAEWVKGEAERSGVDASYQLSSMYALSLGWGDIAKEFVESLSNPTYLQNFWNQWLGKTWERHGRKRSPDEIAEALRGDFSRGEIVDEIAMLTVGIDVQDTYFVWILCGWDINETCYVIDYGETVTFDTLLKGVLAGQRATLAGDPMPIRIGGIDSGHRTDEIYGICQQVGDSLRPTKGVDSLQKPFIASNLEQARSDTRKALARRAGMYLWKFHKNHYQEWLQQRLDGENKLVSGLVLCDEAASDPDFMAQLTNNAPVKQLRGNVIWEKIHESSPDDYRDALVIARLAKDMWTNGRNERLQTLHQAREVVRNRMKGGAKRTEKKQRPRHHERAGGWLGGMR